MFKVKTDREKTNSPRDHLDNLELLCERYHIKVVGNIY